MADVEMTDAPLKKTTKASGGDTEGKKRFEVKKVREYVVRMVLIRI